MIQYITYCKKPVIYLNWIVFFCFPNIKVTVKVSLFHIWEYDFLTHKQNKTQINKQDAAKDSSVNESSSHISVCNDLLSSSDALLYLIRQNQTKFLWRAYNLENTIRNILLCRLKLRLPIREIWCEIFLLFCSLVFFFLPFTDERNFSDLK